MSTASESPLDNVRQLILGDNHTEVARLQKRVDELDATVARLEQLVADTDDRARAVGEVLVEAIDDPESSRLGVALQPSLEHAVHVSARADSSVLASALYPVMGPALRKMIAELFSFGGDENQGGTFAVDQVLLIERTTGLLLASSSHSNSRGDADVVSGMLDAIRLFVQDAFEATEHDGLRDLRVGDTSVLVEWGPRAVLASVTRGVPTDSYRVAAAQALEEVHVTHANPLQDFDGTIEPFENVVPILDGIEAENRSALDKVRSSNTTLILGLLVLVMISVNIILLAT